MRFIEKIRNFFSFHQNTEASDVNEPTQQIDLEYDELKNDPYYTSMGVDLDENQTGACGEDYFCYLFRKGNFYVQFLGEKAPDVDCLVSFDADGNRYEFLVQVKSTGSVKYQKKTITSGLTTADYDKLLKYHLPTYLARVDIDSNTVFIKGAFSAKPQIGKTRVSISYPLTTSDLAHSRKIMNKLATEVKKYWETGLQTSHKQSFTTTFN